MSIENMLNIMNLGKVNQGFYVHNDAFAYFEIACVWLVSSWMFYKTHNNYTCNL